MEKDNGIDKLFKDGLNDPEIPFNELDWAKMEQKLDARTKKKVLPFWLFATSGVAAALVVGLFLYFSGSDKADKQPKKIEIVESKKEKPLDNIPTVTGADTGSVLKKIGKPIVMSAESPVKNIDKSYVSSPKTITNNEDLVPIPDTNSIKETNRQELIAETATSKLEEKGPAIPLDSPLTGKKGKRGALTLSIMAAPDISNAKANVDTKISSNIGLLATYALTNKISVTTGAIYSRKLYNYGGIRSAGTTYMQNAWQVDADCIVLDVPLNVNYTFLKKRNFSVGVNTGLSSYFMLNEKYKYITGPQGGTQKISELEIRNQNQHILGVANLSISFERKITNTLSFGVQPFIKLPLTGIGNGDARLKSTGVAFSLNLGLFPKSGGK